MSYSTTLESFAFAFCTIFLFFHNCQPSFPCMLSLDLCMVEIVVVRGQGKVEGEGGMQAGLQC